MNAPSFITVGDGTRLAYRFDGQADKPVLMLSNSIGTTMAMWDPQIASLSENFYILRYDARGHGASDAPAGAYSLDRLGHDVVELLDALHLDRVHFLGISLGGFVGQWLGIYAPQRLDKLILANTSAYLGPSPQWNERIRQLQTSPDMAAVAENFLGNWFSADFIRRRPDTIEIFRAMLLTTPPQGLAGSFAAVRDADLRRTATLIDLPVLIIAGQYDTVTALSHSEALAALLPQARLKVLPVVHLSNIERPVEFVAWVREFLR